MFTPKQERNGVDQGVATVQSGAPSADMTGEVSAVMATATALGLTYNDFKSGITVESPTSVGTQTVPGVVHSDGVIS